MGHEMEENREDTWLMSATQRQTSMRGNTPNLMCQTSPIKPHLTLQIPSGSDNIMDKVKECLK
jgi:hypothetical protein